MRLRREGSGELGSRLREKRTQRGMTLKQLSGQTGISQPYLSQIERGDVNNPTIEVLCRILEALGEDLTLQGSNLNEGREPLMYGSPFTLEELAEMDEEYSGQGVVRLVREALKDPEVPLDQRKLLARQIESLVAVTRDELRKGCQHHGE